MRCYCCNSTPDGFLSEIPFNRNRIFYYDEQRSWLEICSDCKTPTDFPLDYEFGEVPLLESSFDD